MKHVTCSTVVQKLLAPGSVGNRAGVEDVLVLITGGRSNDMKKTLAQAAKAREAGLRIVVVGISVWINAVELAGVASYPYASTRLLLPAGFETLPSIHSQLRDMICNSTFTVQRQFVLQSHLLRQGTRASPLVSISVPQMEQELALQV